MYIEHIAIWCKDMEALKNFYISHFNGKANSKYINPKTGFESYFISFDKGCRIELMSRRDIPDNQNDIIEQYKGLIHFAFEVDTMQEVEQKAEELKSAGITILRGPRKTGDDYYEFEALDPEKIIGLR